VTEIIGEASVTATRSSRLPVTCEGPESREAEYP
jgi:hypothetical protein